MPGMRQAPRNVADERDTVGAEIEHDGGEDPADHDDERPGHPRRDDRQPEEHAPARSLPTRSVVPLRPSSSPSTQDRNSRQTLSPSASVPVSFESSPTVTSIAAPKRNPVITALERNSEIHPSLKIAISRKSTPATRATPATSGVASGPPTTPAMITALPATADSDELGPVEICREVPNSA